MGNIFQKIADELSIRHDQVVVTVTLLDGGATVPFIARYRKEATGELNDTQLRKLEERLKYHREIEERRGTILKTIRDQEKLTPELEQAILTADTKNRLEDLYLPYKPKRTSKAQIAKEAGLEPLADSLLNQPELSPECEAEKYLNAEHKIETIQAALDGAKQILMDRFSERADLISSLRELLQERGRLSSRVNEKRKANGVKYKDYFDYDELIKKVPSHRVLAIFRGRREGVLQTGITLQDFDDTNKDLIHPAEAMIANDVGIKNKERPADKWLQEVVRWTWKIRIYPRLETEIFVSLREQADESAIEVFSKNLSDLLMAPPAGVCVTMGLDPGFRTGVKVAVVDCTGKYLESETIYPHAPQNRWSDALGVIAKLVLKHNVEFIAIGNGTASRETERLVDDLIKKFPKLKVKKAMVSEAGASVYSASEVGAQEFPDLDASFRGAVSIARRLQDPLAELVKIDPKAIGVGQYQHDVNQKKLAESLGCVVEDCVNAVGVNLNTASVVLLEKVSGLNSTVASNIVAFRDNKGSFESRAQLQEVAMLGAKTYEQCAGFLRISNGKNPLDQSAVHPESYPVIERIIEKNNRDIKNIIGDVNFLNTLKPEHYTDDKFGVPTVADILKELKKPGKDPRPEFKTANFKEGVSTINDLKPDMVLEGVVTNVTHFGAFVDVGVHQDGLVHISALCDGFVKDPCTVVKAGDIVKVKVLDIECDRRRITLSMRLSDKPNAAKSKNTENRRAGTGSKASTRYHKTKDHKPKTGTFADLFANAKRLR